MDVVLPHNTKTHGILLVLFDGAIIGITAPCALGFGFWVPWPRVQNFSCSACLGRAYIAIVRGVPDIAFFMFFVIALDQFLEWSRHKILCPDWSEPIRQGNDFVVCQAAKLPSSAPQWIHETYGFALAVFTFAIVFGAFSANVLFGAMRAVPMRNRKQHTHTV